MHIVVHDSLAEINAAQWNALLADNNPFMRHEFLSGLESTGCVSEDHGWEPTHISAYTDECQTQLIGALPCYIKQHSYGEYIFDWAWADAYYRNGLEYYPKLCNAVPFTPATGPRWIVDPDQDANSVGLALLNAALDVVAQKELSSFHSLFLPQMDTHVAETAGLSLRSSNQFHWHNQNYASFDRFLAQLTSKKRKNINRERRRVHEQDVTFQWFTQQDLTQEVVEQFYAFYLRTVRYYGAQAYLNLAFFKHLAATLSNQTLILLVHYQNTVIAGSFFMRSDTTLYGRYWGAQANFHSVHFETCYYQPIQYCIEHGLQKFEAGAQGEHKLSRGLEPSLTHSAHWISQPEFRTAIEQFLQQETEHIDQYQASLRQHSPFRQEV